MTSVCDTPPSFIFSALDCYQFDSAETYIDIDKMANLRRLGDLPAPIYYSELGASVIDYLRFARRLHLCREKFDAALNMRFFKDRYYITSLALLRLGIAQCGEINSFIKIHFFEKSDLDGHLFSLALINKEDIKKTHAFSIFVPRCYTASLPIIKSLLTTDAPFIGFHEIAKIIPKASVIDGYFRESGSLETITESCPQLTSYLEKYNLTFCAESIVTDSKSRPLTTEELRLHELESNKLVSFSSWLELEKHPFLDHLSAIYTEELKRNKQNFRKTFSQFEWKDSGAHLFVIAPQELLWEFCQTHLTSIEHSLSPSLIEEGHYFLSVFMGPNL